MKRVCIFCGSNTGANPAYIKAAQEIGRTLAQRSIGLVYGGVGTGLMGALADAVIDSGGEAIGVIPSSIIKEDEIHKALTELRLVNSMHERKAVMADISDAFVALPGGFGTFEEICEIITWSQLGLHDKPCGLVNVEGYYDYLLKFFDNAVKERFISKKDRSLLVVDSDVVNLLDLVYKCIDTRVD